MKRISYLLGITLLAGPTPTVAASFSHRPYLQDEGVDVLNRTVARQLVDRDLLANPYDTAVIGHVDVYDRFPYVESRWFQVVSDSDWNRLLVGEVGGDLRAEDAAASAVGALDQPRGLAVDEHGTVYVADSGNHRVVVFDSHTEFGSISLTPRYVIDGLSRPYDVAFSDGGTPFVAGDDRLYVADTGSNRVVAFALESHRAVPRAEVGELGSGAGHFAGPFAIAVGHENGVNTSDVYVADAHNGRIVHLNDRGDHLEWSSAQRHEVGLVTSLDTDHWGHVYAAAPASGQVVKFANNLETLARVETGLDRPRAFHVPFVTRTDHRNGSVERRGQGAGVLVEQWTEATGIRVLQIGADVADLHLKSEAGVRADFLLTDRAAVAGSVLDDRGNVVRTQEAGTINAGRTSLEFTERDLVGLPAGEYTLRVSAESGYEESPGGAAEGTFQWNGSSLESLDRVALLGGTPNPFQTATTLRFAVPANAPSHSVAVFDISGRLVRQLANGAVAAGMHSVTWNGRDTAGREVSAGIYFVQLTVGDAVDTHKVVHFR
ncbi:MAG: hypothetical protein DHS20C21_04390 [Gemmatimonadota bacterium]|nr:MAG: hypothetical protein DHS20C21_04390 [Gemmatimonadota bacterium]